MLLLTSTDPIWLMDERHLRAMVTTMRSAPPPNAEFLAASRAQDATSEPAREYVMVGDVAVVPVRGVMTKRLTWLTWMMGGTATEQTRKQLRLAANDPAVKSIVLHVSSGGGSVEGTGDLADDVRRVNALKPIVTFAEDVMASAAVWVGSQAERIIASPYAQVGSIGVYGTLVSFAKLNEQHGVDVRIVRSTPKKALGHPDEPITDEVVESAQAEINAIHDLFVADIAAGRGLTFDDATALGDGRLHSAKDAKRLDLVDEVGSFESAIFAAIELSRKPRADSTPTINAAPKEDARTNGESLNITDAASKSTVPASEPSKDGMSLTTGDVKKGDEQHVADDKLDLAAQITTLAARLEATERSLKDERDARAAEAQRSQERAKSVLEKTRSDALALLGEAHAGAINIMSTTEQVEAYVAGIEGAGITALVPRVVRDDPAAKRAVEQIKAHDDWLKSLATSGRRN